MKSQKQFRETQVIALTVPCTYCHAKQYEPCTNKETNKPLINLPAHQNRIKAAEQGTPF